MITLGVWTEKKPGQGEDAEPLVLYHDGSRLGLLAVCDGVGGAGVQIAGRTRGGTERSGAWVSSRAVRLAIEQFFVQHVRFDSLLDLAESPDPAAWRELTAPEPPSLRHSIDGVLAELRNPARSRIGGTMQRELPSTLAAILYRVQPVGVEFRIRWAGDSRCYLLTAEAGLQQLSRDDTEIPDALSSLEQDPPMTNQIAADGRYEIRSAPGQFAMPCVLLCATDGFFNYVQTPAHFEYILLDTLAGSADPAGWGELLARKVQDYTQDDASLALVAAGYNNFGELRAAFGGRLAALREEHWQPFQGLAQPDDGSYREARLGSWQRYRPGYERRIPQPSEARG
jgi:serine/threonine protein phosphatase PrpC